MNKICDHIQILQISENPALSRTDSIFETMTSELSQYVMAFCNISDELRISVKKKSPSITKLPLDFISFLSIIQYSKEK